MQQHIFTEVFFSFVRNFYPEDGGILLLCLITTFQDPWRHIPEESSL
jgi:hypothetical protein